MRGLVRGGAMRGSPKDGRENTARDGPAGSVVGGDNGKKQQKLKIGKNLKIRFLRFLGQFLSIFNDKNDSVKFQLPKRTRKIFRVQLFYNIQYVRN